MYSKFCLIIYKLHTIFGVVSQSFYFFFNIKTEIMVVYSRFLDQYIRIHM